VEVEYMEYKPGEVVFVLLVVCMMSWIFACWVVAMGLT
jgi:hypothetical protein